MSAAAHENTSSVLPGEGAGGGRWEWGWGETVLLLLLLGNWEKFVWEAGITAVFVLVSLSGPIPV